MADGLFDKVYELNSFFRTKELSIIKKSDLRELIHNKIGRINKVIDNPDVLIKLSKKGILSIDGSIANVGATYPFQLTLLRSCAVNTKEDVNEERMIKIDDIFCPIIPSNRNMLDEIIYKSNNKMTYDNALSLFNKIRLAELEIEIAIKGIENFEPSLILLDGGFIRYEILCPALLETFKSLCISKNIIAVGVIEEVSTHKLSDLLFKDISDCMVNDYDREMLFGILNEKEWIKVDKDIEIKKGYYTSFARLSKHPQAIAIDLFKEQINEIDDVVNILASLTPNNSRGIPILIDIVDQQVRITNKEVDILMSGLDKDIQEKFLIAHKDRRQY